MLSEDMNTVYAYSQPYKRKLLEVGTKQLGWELVFTSEQSLYNLRPRTPGANTVTELWARDISDFHLYKGKYEKTEYPTTIVNVKLTENDRQFKNLTEFKKLMICDSGYALHKCAAPQSDRIEGARWLLPYFLQSTPTKECSYSIVDIRQDLELDSGLKHGYHSKGALATILVEAGFKYVASKGVPMMFNLSKNFKLPIN